jgi:hypothetical protein
MIRLSERTLQGMQRAYDGTLDAFALAYRLQKTDTATGRKSDYVRMKDDKDCVLDAIPLRIDPDVVDEQPKASSIEKGNQSFVSVTTDAPIFEQGDRLALLDDCQQNEIEVYEIKGAADRRSGVTFDRKYRAVRVA